MQYTQGDGRLVVRVGKIVFGTIVVSILLIANASAGFSQGPQAQTRIAQQIIVNGQPANGAYVQNAGGIQTFTCTNPQPYSTPGRASSGWACYDQSTATYLLNALPPVQAQAPRPVQAQAPPPAPAQAQAQAQSEPWPETVPLPQPQLPPTVIYQQPAPVVVYAPGPYPMYVGPAYGPAFYGGVAFNTGVFFGPRFYGPAYGYYRGGGSYRR